MEVDASSSSAATAGAAAATSASAAPIEAAGSRSTRNYVVSAQKPTVVNACVVGNFRTPRDSDLIISRINRIEMMLVTEDGLKPHREIPIFGRIALIRAFKAPGEKKDSLLILTCKNHLAVLGFTADGDVRTRASGNLTDKVARQAESGMLASVHKSGLLKIVQWADDRDLTSYNLRFGDAQINDFTFLDSKDIHGRPSIAYIYQDLNGRHLKVCGIDTREKELSLTWKQDNIESEASLLVPVPFYGGVIVIGQESVSYHKDATNYTAVAPPFIHMAQICCYALVDSHGERILLGDIQGKLYMLVLVTKEGGRQHREIVDIKVQLLGEISIPEALVYLDNSVVFIGSRLGDSQLVRIVAEPNEATHGTFLEVLDTFANLGPIRDLIVVDVDGQNQIITCSGGYKEGSLRVVRSGIGIEESAFFPLAGVRQLFALNLASKLDNYLVVSFVNVTHLLRVDEDDWADSAIEGFDLSVATLYAGILRESGSLIQVTSVGINLISAEQKPRAKYAATIALCAVNVHSGQILIASSNRLAYLLVSGQTIELLAEIEFERDISCVDLACLDEAAPSKLAAVGLWDENLVWILRVDGRSIERLQQTKIVGDALSRSILVTRMENVLYTMIALGDGTLFYYQLDEANGTLTEEKKATVGTRPTRLKRFQARAATNIFACSDRPAVVFSSNQKLLFSNVNLKLVNEMCLLNTAAYPNALALADSDRLFIGQIDEIQKLHIRSVPLGEGVSRIAHQPETNTIAILTSRLEYTPCNGGGGGNATSSLAAVAATASTSSTTTVTSATTTTTTPATAMSVDEDVERLAQRRSVPTMCTSRTQLSLSSGATTGRSASAPDVETELIEIYSVCILDANTLEVLYVIELPATEVAISLCAANLGDANAPLYVVGTSYIVPEDPEPKLGRILVFTWDNSKLRLVQEKEVKGCVYSVGTLHNKLVCSINSSVRLFAWTAEQELRMEASSFNFVQALCLKTKGDLLLIGDLMRSVTMLAYRHTETQFEEVAHDYAPEWTTAVEIIDADSVIAGENAYNLFTCYKDVQTDTDDDRARFQQTGYWYLGENVNVFRRGTLHAASDDAGSSALAYSNPIIYGTADGSLGVIVQLPEETFRYLRELQTRVAKHISNCTRIDYNDYRNFCSDRSVQAHDGFVDGDLIEGLADLPRERVAKVVAGLKPPPNADQSGGDSSVEQVLRLVEDLARLH